MAQAAALGAGRYPPDHLSTLPTRELNRIMRESDSLPLAALLNRGGIRVDSGARRVWRDCFWKGSFAKDTLLGWEERLMTPIRASGPQYTGGRFWKRFDEIRDGQAYGLIVNYGLSFLPGLPIVREEAFADDSRPYARAGDRVLLLTYRNQPYRIVYDLIKVVDEDNCIGVMHLGTYPRGRVFSTFVMSRSNHPFEKMAVPDHDAVFTSAEARTPSASQVAGTWRGCVVFSKHPDLTLHHQFNPPIVRVRFPDEGRTEAQMRVGLFRSSMRVEVRNDELVLEGRSGRRERLRQIDADVLLGRRTVAGSETIKLRYVLTRARD
jgi:hypothetical protein